MRRKQDEFENKMNEDETKNVSNTKLTLKLLEDFCLGGTGALWYHLVNLIKNPHLAVVWKSCLLSIWKITRSLCISAVFTVKMLFWQLTID